MTSDVAVLERPLGREARVFLASFLVLFLEVALIRWMPAYIRLLAYFSNFILLASFLGIGVGCLLAPSRRRLFVWFPLLQAVVIGAAYFFRLEVAVQSTGSIYFSSGTAAPVVVVESTMLLPLVFVIVAALFATLAQRMGSEMAALPPLRGYTINLVGSLAGVALFAVISWLQLSPTWWFGVGFAAALPLLLTGEPGVGPPAVRLKPDTTTPGARISGAFAVVNVSLLALTLVLVHVMARGSLWSPYYKITVGQDGPDTVVEVNNIFHQSMAPVDQKEYFYQWPYMVFGDTFENVLVLGAGSGTDVAAALRHGAKHVDAVEIDPIIVRLGRQFHPDHPYSDPRVTVVTDDARHFLRTTTKKYDLVVFALIDSLTMQSSFSGVRLESYMFTEESFRAVRDRLAPNGLLVVYNYFREQWLVDRLANIAANAFGQEPRVHVHEARAYLGVMMVGPRLSTLTADPVVPDRVTAFGQSHAPSPARMLVRDKGVEPATDDWPFLYLHTRHIPSHYLAALALVLVVSVVVGDVRPARASGDVVVAVFPPRRRLHAARDQVDHPVCAAVGLDVGRGVAGDRVGPLDGAGRQLCRDEGRGAPSVVRRAGARRVTGAQLPHPGGRDRFREPCRRIDLLRGADVQPDSLCRAALRVRDQTLDVSVARLRHKPARRDGGWRRRVSSRSLPDSGRSCC